ncbi:MAG: hypothetical protein JW973_07655 [Bacteroidales bacterium]|nr:hypothetical protein [Bacteroidales bacterium]MBN2600957.1 hypothetical protein [Candidatus Neomarinimicrobiota bacterium]
MKFLLLILFLLNLSACTKIEKVYLLPEREEIVDALNEKIASDGVFSIDGLNDGGAYFLDYSSSSLGKVSFPDTAEYSIDDIKIGRQITQILDTTIVYNIKWDSAYVNVKYNFKGNLKIVLYDIVTDSTVSSVNYIEDEVYDTTGFNVDSVYIELYNIWLYDTTYTVDTNSVIVDSTFNWSYEDHYSAVDSTTKNFIHRTEQKAIFLRTDNSNNAVKDWELKKVTPIVFEPINESFVISEVEFSTSGNSSRITLPEDDDTDWLETYFVRDSLTEIDYQGNLILSSVTVTNTDPYNDEPGEVILAHFGQGVNVYKIRKGLADSNDDGSHSGSFTVNSHGSHVYRLFIDAIDYRTILTRTGSYNSHIIMIPFRVP